MLMRTVIGLSSAVVFCGAVQAATADFDDLSERDLGYEDRYESSEAREGGEDGRREDRGMYQLNLETLLECDAETCGDWEPGEGAPLVDFEGAELADEDEETEDLPAETPLPASLAMLLAGLGLLAASKVGSRSAANRASR